MQARDMSPGSTYIEIIDDEALDGTLNEIAEYFANEQNLAEKNLQEESSISNSKKTLQQMNAQGNDWNLATHGFNNRKYWYSIADGMGLLVAIRKSKFMDEPNAYTENNDGIFLANPYHQLNFKECLLDDIKRIKGAYGTQAWEKNPKLMSIPVLVGLHWNCVRVEIDYSNKAVSVLFDDPYGEGRFNQNLKKNILISIKEHLPKLFEPQTTNIKFSEVYKKVNQQGNDNGYDCGPIVFSNIEDYCNNSKTNSEFENGNLTISEATEDDHEKEMIFLRAEHVKKFGEVTGNLINDEHISKIRKAIKQSIAGKKESLILSKDIEQKIGELPEEYIEHIFNFMDTARISAKEAYESIMAEMQLNRALKTPGKQGISVPANTSMGQDEDLMVNGILIEGNRIRKVKFIDRDVVSNYAPSLETFQEWSDIPNFAIITGSNGTGKSHLLKYLERMSEKNGGMRKKGVYSNVLYRSVSDQNSSFQEFSDRDTNYYITNIEARNELISAVKQCVESRVSRKDHVQRYPIYEELVKKALKASAEELADDDWWTKEIESCRDYNLARHDVNEPVNTIYNVLHFHCTKDKAIKQDLGKIENLKKLRKHYQEQGNSGDDFYREFIEGDQSFKDKIIDSYLRAVNPPPKDAINKVLLKYGFKHEIKGISSGSNNRTLVFGLRDNDESKISYHKLSSGEKVAIDIISQLYSFQGLPIEDEIVEIKKVNIMLLDEPDRHLDADLCKVFFEIVYKELVQNGVQVIMTTHRTDTIALAPEGNNDIGIFSLKNAKDGVVSIKRYDNKLDALLTLTPNLRCLINFHIKVHVESHEDSMFYESAYSSLMSYCKIIKKKYLRGDTGERHYEWIYLDKLLNPNQDVSIPQSNEYRKFLSQRYQLAFHSVGLTEDGQSGGSSIVLQSVPRDCHASDIRARRWEKQKDKGDEDLINPKLMKSFGIIDKDYGENKRKVKGILKPRMSILNRHSLENYIYDPFIFCSILTEEDFNKFKDPEFKEICIEIQSELSKCCDITFAKQELIDAYFKYILTRIINKIDADLGDQSLEQQKEGRKKAQKVCQIICEFKGERVIKLIEAPFTEGFIKELERVSGVNLTDKFKTKLQANIKAFIKTGKLEDLKKALGKIGPLQCCNKGELDKAVNDYIENTATCYDRTTIEQAIGSTGYDIVAKFMKLTNPISVIKNNATNEIIVIKDVMYPILFLEFRGHNIADTVNALHNISQEEIIDKISEAESLCIPFDLAETFFALSYRARLQGKGKDGSVIEIV
ncbi:MAG: hypothetical protein K0R73_1362 [Candidatus Midichloriaceae bacterium]|jgi:energy-coupling factor transporter ATP-binding protein EcfA2|nr:hypothetical protein [Candidatus Midichloriaceae bacterium]